MYYQIFTPFTTMVVFCSNFCLCTLVAYIANKTTHCLKLIYTPIKYLKGNGSYGGFPIKVHTRGVSCLFEHI